MRTFFIIIVASVALGSVISAIPFRLLVTDKTASAENGTYISTYVDRIEDTQKGITCYTTGPSGISCVVTALK